MTTSGPGIVPLFSKNTKFDGTNWPIWKEGWTLSGTMTTRDYRILLCMIGMMEKILGLWDTNSFFLLSQKPSHKLVWLGIRHIPLQTNKYILMNYKTYILKEFWKLSETFTSVKLSGEHLILLPMQVNDTSNPPVPPPLPVACLSSLLVLPVGTVPTAVPLVCLLLFSYFSNFFL